MKNHPTISRLIQRGLKRSLSVLLLTFGLFTGPELFAQDDNTMVYRNPDSKRSVHIKGCPRFNKNTPEAIASFPTMTLGGAKEKGWRLC